MKRILIEWNDANIRIGESYQTVCENPFVVNTHIGWLKSKNKTRTIIYFGGNKYDDGDYLIIPTAWVRKITYI